jgi:opacity protein-like surface antigen
MKTVLLSALSILVLSAAPAWAQAPDSDSGSSSKWKLPFDLNLDFSPENFYAQGGLIYSPDLAGSGDASTGIRIGAGLKLDSMYAAELALVVQGSANEQVGAPGSRKWEVSGIMFTGVAHYDLDQQMAVFGRAGIYLVDIDTSTTLGTSDSEKRAELVLGGGATYKVNELVDAYAELDLISDELSFIAIGVRYNFK